MTDDLTDEDHARYELILARTIAIQREEEQRARDRRFFRRIFSQAAKNRDY